MVQEYKRLAIKNMLKKTYVQKNKFSEDRNIAEESN